MAPKSTAWKPDLVDALQQPIWTARLDGTIDHVNVYWSNYTGVSAEDAERQAWTAVVHPDDVATAEAEWIAGASRETPFEIEFRLRRADGDWRWHIARVAQVPGPDDGTRWWCAIAIDIDERRKARLELRASEARYRELVANADDIIYTLRLDGRVMDVNQAVERVLGYHPDELVGTLFERLVVSDQLAYTKGMLDRKLGGEPSSRYELDVMTKGGRRVTLEINTRLIVSDGVPTAIHGVARDISSRRQQIRQAQLSAAIGAALTARRPLDEQLQACMQAIVDHLGSAFARVWLLDQRDPRSLVLRASAGMYTHLDGGHSRIAVGEYKIGRIAARREPFLTNNVLNDPEISDHDWARREGMIAFAGYPLLLAGHTLGVVGLFSRHRLDDTTLSVLRSVVDAIAVAIDRDLVERARDTVLVREREARVWAELAETRYRNLFEGVADGIVVSGDELTVQDANAAALRIFGYDRDEFIGGSLGRLVAGPLSWSPDQREALIAAGEWQGELELLRNDGSTVPVEVRTTVVHVPNGPVYLSAVRDISERRHLERLQRDFLAMVTHDIRTPLTSIKGWLQLLQRREYLRERDRTTVRRTLDQVETISHLINDLADLVRMEAGQLHLNLEPVDLVPLVREQVDMVQEQTKTHRLRLEARDGPIEGAWDRQRIAQVFQNLLTNAVKYSPRGGDVNIRVDASEEMARVQVTDRGIGISPEHLPLLFERFYREGVTGAGGLGLGLHITRMLVEAHGGMVTAESDQGAGSTFTVTLPLTPARG